MNAASRREAGAPRVLALAGATGTGKTAISLVLAERLDGEIVCADSRQIYRGLEIATGKPTPEERARRPHHLFDWLDPRERASAGAYARAGAQHLEAIVARGRVPIVVGGSGLYLRALRSGLSPIPPVRPEVRERVRRALAERGASALHAELAKHDPVSAERLAPADRQRVARALEVALSSGRPLSGWQRLPPAPPAIPAAGWRFFAPVRERAALHAALDRRAHEFYDAGLLDEVRALLAAGIPPGAPALTGLGYREAVACLAGRIDRAEAIARTAQGTRRYAKRQETWWRGEGERVGLVRLPIGPAPDPEHLAERIAERWSEEHRRADDATRAP